MKAIPLWLPAVQQRCTELLHQSAFTTFWQLKTSLNSFWYNKPVDASELQELISARLKQLNTKTIWQ